MPNGRRTRNRYVNDSSLPFKVSRSGIENFIECPRCFYLDRKLGIARPGGLPFNLNSAVDALLKKEFDIYRESKSVHPLMKEYHIDAIPYSHPDLETWRENFKGIQFHHKATNLLITGAVDDIWINRNGDLHVVDYKSTSKAAEIVELNEDWHISYKRQMEIYQWLLRQIGLSVSNTCYWVYANGDKTKDRFDATLHFRMTIIPYSGNDSWVEAKLFEIKHTLDSSTVPSKYENCEYCTYVELQKQIDGD